MFNKLIVILLALAVVVCCKPAHAQSPEERAEMLFNQGKAAAEVKDWNQAYQLLSEAWQLKQSYDIASNLGQVAYLLGKHAEAAQHVSFGLRHFPVTGDAEQKQKAESLLELVRQKVSSLTLKVSHGDAQISIDDELRGRADGLPPELFVEPGEHRVVARRDEEAVTREVSAKPGGRYRLELSLSGAEEAIAGAPVSDPAPGEAPGDPVADVPPNEPSEGMEPKFIALIVGGGLTVASGIALGVYASKRSRASADVDVYRARVEEENPGPNPCAGSNPSANCQALAEANEDWESSGRMRNIFLGTTIALGAATAATFLLWPDSSGGAEAGARLVPLMTTEQQGLLLSGSF